MNEQLIKLIELCLMDGVVTDKEREVIFKKSEELGISKDECEIILEGMIQKHSKENSPKPKKVWTSHKSRSRLRFWGRFHLLITIIMIISYWMDKLDGGFDVAPPMFYVITGVIFLFLSFRSFGKRDSTQLNTSSSEELQDDEKVKEEPIVDLSTDDFKENETLGSEKVEESIEVLKEEISNELIRIITKDIVGFYCFEFKTDSIKVLNLRRIYSNDDIKGSPCFIEQFDEKLQVLDENESENESEYDLKVKDGEIFYDNDSVGVVKLYDFHIISGSFTLRHNDRVVKYIRIQSQNEFKDGSRGIMLGSF